MRKKHFFSPKKTEPNQPNLDYQKGKENSHQNKYVPKASSSSRPPAIVFDFHQLLPEENIAVEALAAFQTALIHHMPCIFQLLRPLLWPKSASRQTSI